jgi:hypothetical protein
MLVLFCVDFAQKVERRRRMMDFNERGKRFPLLRLILGLYY